MINIFVLPVTVGAIITMYDALNWNFKTVVTLFVDLIWDCRYDDHYIRSANLEP